MCRTRANIKPSFENDFFINFGLQSSQKWEEVEQVGLFLPHLYYRWILSTLVFAL